MFKVIKVPNNTVSHILDKAKSEEVIYTHAFSEKRESNDNRKLKNSNTKEDSIKKINSNKRKTIDAGIKGTPMILRKRVNKKQCVKEDTRKRKNTNENNDDIINKENAELFVSSIIVDSIANSGRKEKLSINRVIKHNKNRRNCWTQYEVSSYK